MRNEDFTDAMRPLTIEALRRMADHMGEDKDHSAVTCPYCWAMARLVQASDDAAEAVATYRAKEP